MKRMDSSAQEQGPRSNERGSGKKEAEILRQKKAEMAYLENQFKSTRNALERNPDPYAQRHLVSVLTELEGRIIELAKEHDLDQPINVISRLHGKTPEDLKREAQTELDKLRYRKTQHEGVVLYGDPESRERLYEFEHDARQIAKKYGLDESHIREFIVPDEIAQIPITEYEAPRSDSPNEEEPPLAEKASVKKDGFFKSLFKRETKEEKAERAYAKDRDGILISLGALREKYILLTENEADSQLATPIVARVLAEARGAWSRLRPEDQNIELLGNMASALNTIESGESQNVSEKKESLAEKIKRGFRKYFAVGLLTATAVGSPLKTSDTRLPAEKILAPTEAAAPVKNMAEKKNTVNVAGEIASRPLSEKQTRVESPTLKKIPFDSLRQVRDNAHQEMLGERKIDTASIFNTPIETDTAASEEVVFPTYPDEAPTPVAPLYAPLPVAPVSPGQTPENIRGAGVPVAMGIESAAPYASTGKVLYDEPRSHSGKIKVAYFDKNGNTLDTAAIRNEQKIVYTPMPKKVAQAPVTARQEKQTTIAKDTVAQSENQTNRAETNRSHPENLRPYVRPTMDTVKTEIIPAQIEIALPGRANSHGEVDTLHVETPDAVPGWKWGKAPGDYVYKRLVNPTDQQLNNGEFWMRDPEFFVMRNGVEIPHFIRLRMDETLIKAFDDAPAALELYTEKTRYGESHDPYIITVWNGNAGTEYVIGERGLLATAPRHVERKNKIAYGNLQIKIESDNSGAHLSVNGENLSEYEGLSQTEKDHIAYICTSTGKTEFDYFSIDNTPAMDGTFQKFDLRAGANYALTNTSHARILEETQILLDEVWNNYRIREYVTLVEKNENGTRVEDYVWRRDYEKRPEKIITTLAEKKVTTPVKKPRIMNRKIGGGIGTGKKTPTLVNGVRGKTQKQATDSVVKKEKFDVYLYR